MIWLLLVAAIPSLVISCIVGYLVRRYGPRLGLVDNPGARKVHANPMPTAGGLAIWAGVMAPFVVGQIVLMLLWDNQAQELRPLASALPETITVHLQGLAYQSGRLWSLLLGGTVLVVLGLLDDRFGLNWKIRIGVEFVLASVLVWQGWQLTIFVPMPWLTGLISVFWIVGLINSFNMLDNMDGLSAGVAAIAGSMLAMAMLMAPDPVTNQPQLFVGGFLLILVGSLLGFLWHNRPPAKLFMGDAGSYLIGYLLAMATVTATFAGTDVPRHAILAPLCVLAVPLYDTVTVILIRLRDRRSPFEGDKSHFSHRLVELGMTKPQAVGTIYLTTATCGLGALLLRQVDGVGACIILLLIACVLVLVGILETTGRRSRRSDTPGETDVPQ